MYTDKDISPRRALRALPCHYNPLKIGTFAAWNPTRYHARKPLDIGMRWSWEFGEGVDSARGLAAIVVFCRNRSCNNSWDAIVRSDRESITSFLLFRVQWFVCSSSSEGTFQTYFNCGHSGRYCTATPCRFHPFSKHPMKRSEIKWVRQEGERKTFAVNFRKLILVCDTLLRILTFNGSLWLRNWL